MTIARSADCTETITVMTKMVTSCVTAVPVRLIHMREVKKMTDNLVNKSGDLVNDLVNDTISRAAALDALDKRFDSIPMEQTTEILLLRKDLRKLPSAQPEIIHCKDCKYNPNPPECGNAACVLFYGMTDQMGFCHHGERRERE